VTRGVANHAQLDAGALADLEAAVARHTTLERVLDALAATRPPVRVTEIITQDEYTHDVVVPYARPYYLVYDVT
jgi:hypothetical protein